MVDERLKRKASLMWVPLDKMRVREEIAQRKFRPHWANEIARDFSFEKFGTPTVNKIGDWYWILDGQHRIAALKQWLEEPDGQKVECWVYHKLSEKDEAEMFLTLNHVRAVPVYDKFVAALTAGREEETNIEAIVRKNGLTISQKHGNESLSCVGTLKKVYRRGMDCLDRDLKIAYGAFGDSGLSADILEGFGMLVSRYDGRLDDSRMIKALANIKGGVNTLRQRANQLRQQTGVQKAHCIAAAAVEVNNRGKGGKKLPTWWKTEDSA